MGRLVSNIKQRIPASQQKRIAVVSTTRIRGSRWMAIRREHLRNCPLCVMCDAEGVVRAAQVLDHVVPLWKGGSADSPRNLQSLCNEHHDAKTALEAKERSVGPS